MKRKIKKLGIIVMLLLFSTVIMPGFSITVYSEVNTQQGEYDSNDSINNQTESNSELKFTFPKTWKYRVAFENNKYDGIVIDKRIILEDNEDNIIIIDSWKNQLRTSFEENYRRLEGVFFKEEPNTIVPDSYSLSFSVTKTSQELPIKINANLNKEEINQVYSNFFQKNDTIYRVMYIFQKNSNLDKYIKFIKALNIDKEKVFNGKTINKIKFPKIKKDISFNLSKVLAGDDMCGGYTMEGNRFPCCPNGGNCTWWAIYKRPELKDVITWGNAGQDWINQAIQGNYPVTQNPSVGSIVVWDDQNFNSAVSGHVAYIVEVSSDNYFKVSEMSCGDIYPYGSTEKWATKSYLGSSYPLIGFIGYKNSANITIQNQTINQGEYSSTNSITIFPETNVVPVNNSNIIFKIQ